MIRFAATPRVPRVRVPVAGAAARAAGLAPGRYDPAEHGLGDVAAEALRRLGADRVTLWVVAAGAEPARLRGTPGRRAVQWLVGIDGSPTLRVGAGDPDPRTLAPGDALGFELDRERLGWDATGRWVALCAVRGASPPLPRILAPLGDTLVRGVGLENAGYLLLLAAGSLAAGSVVPFVCGASFVHYGIYVATFARRDVAYGEFVRDALLFKAVSMGVLGAIWLAAGPTPTSIAVVTVGVGFSSWSASVLGFERTYFGVELGRVPPRRIDAAPYGWVPHPMVLGAMVALLGVALTPAVQDGWPWLVPAHLAFYLAHLVQEVRAGARWGEP